MKQKVVTWVAYFMFLFMQKLFINFLLKFLFIKGICEIVSRKHYFNQLYCSWIFNLSLVFILSVEFWSEKVESAILLCLKQLLLVLFMLKLQATNKYAVWRCSLLLPYYVSYPTVKQNRTTDTCCCSKNYILNLNNDL